MIRYAALSCIRFRWLLVCGNTLTSAPMYHSAPAEQPFAVSDRLPHSNCATLGQLPELCITSGIVPGNPLAT